MRQHQQQQEQLQQELQQGQKQQEQALDRLLADRPDAFARLLQHRLQELASRLEMLALIQRHLLEEADQLKRELGGR